MKKILLILISLILMSALIACNNPVEPPTEDYQQVLPWQEAYIALLRQYEEKGDRMFFLLHDFDQDGTPELIIAGEYENILYDKVYTFENGEVLRLEYGESVEVASFALSVNGAVWEPPNNAPGLVTYLSGTSSRWGRNLFLSKIVIYENSLVIEAYGRRRIDVVALRDLTENSIEYTDADIQKHIHWYINDNAVSEEEFYRIFGVVLFDTNEWIHPVRITEDNIREIIM